MSIVDLGDTRTASELDPVLGLRMAEQIAQSLSEAHAQGLVLGTDSRTLEDDVHAFGVILGDLFDGTRWSDRDLSTLIGQMKSSVPAERPTATEVLDRLRWIREKPKGRLRAAVTLLRALMRERE